MKRLRGFTLIELLIVVAIIAILAAIAVPNFLEAQTRSKISRAKADMRTIKTGLESYCVDHGAYPYLTGAQEWGYTSALTTGGIGEVTCLTTPVSYLTSVDLKDPFVKTEMADERGLIWEEDSPDDHRSIWLHYINVKMARQTEEHIQNYINSSSWDVPFDTAMPQYVLLSLGPDYIKGPDVMTDGGRWTYHQYAWDYGGAENTNNYAAWAYDPTNGTKSKGDIMMWQ